MRARVLSAEFASELQEPIIGTVIALGFLYAATNTTLAGHELLIMGILLVRTIRSARPIQRGFQRFVQEHDRLRSLERFLAKAEAAADVSGGVRFRTSPGRSPSSRSASPMPAGRSWTACPSISRTPGLRR